MYLDCCRWEYVKMQSREDSLWESFPRAILTHEGPERYINTFRAPFQELPPLSQQEVYALQACSLLVISPPAGRLAPHGGFPTDLAEINLSGWAALVQDVVASLQVLPPGLSHGLGPQVVALLQLLEVATGVGFCHHCCNPQPHCRCVGVPQSTPPNVVESVYGADSRIWGDPLLQWSDHSEYLPGRYVWIHVTSTRDLHLEHAPFGGRYTPKASHNPTLLASHWRGWTAKVCDEHEGYSTTDSLDAYTHPSATSTPPE